jgi:5-methylcytosine-specific restriction endonuclease McrA
VLPDGWFFRPYKASGLGYRADVAATADQSEAPTIEQAYRRGFDQGFAYCKQLVDDNKAQELAKHQKNISLWRKRSVQQFRSPPGDKERAPRKLFGGRASISNRVRWLVLERDEFRCVKCGQTPSETVSLEVDHIVPVAKGGLDSQDNLQTLCNRCNSGKADRL